MESVGKLLLSLIGVFKDEIKEAPLKSLAIFAILGVLLLVAFNTFSTLNYQKKHDLIVLRNSNSLSALMNNLVIRQTFKMQKDVSDLKPIDIKTSISLCRGNKTIVIVSCTEFLDELSKAVFPASFFGDDQLEKIFPIPINKKVNLKSGE